MPRIKEPQTNGPLRIEYRSTATLVPYARNARTHSAEQVAQIAASIREFGWTNPVLVDGANGVIAGHGRILAALKVGIDRVPCIELVHLSEAQRRAYIIADNKLALNAGWDERLLRLELDDLRGGGFDLSLTGFGDGDLGELFAEGNDGLTDPDDAAPLQEPVSVTGNLWTLGRHRLLCGDAREALPAMAARSVDFIFTDPPYGHNNNNGDLIAKREEALGLGKSGPPRPIANDGKEADTIVRWFFAEADRLLAKGGCCCCCGGGGGPDPQFARWSLWLDEALGFKQMVVWDKGPMGMGWHYRRSYETVLVGEKRGGKCRWYDKTAAIENIIRPGDGVVKILPRKDQHPTAKPVALPKHFISLHTAPNHLVLDPFAGEGITLIASEMTGRIAHCIEIDPCYVDVAVRRWQAFTGKHATLDGDGRTFAEIGDARQRLAA